MPFDNTLNDTTEAQTPAACTCEACKLARFEGSKLRNAVVHAYSYRPRSWRLNKVANDPHDYYLGVELETDDYRMDANGLRVRANVRNSVAADMRRPKNLWMAKSDGSVSGPEFVSHPSTLAYWHKHESALKEMFQMLVHAGYRSHDNDKAGMHINISRNAFTDQHHLFRFLTLIHNRASWSLKMSQRTATSASHWASLDYLADEGRRRSECDRVYTPTWSGRLGGASQRYQALNAPAGQPRFEFRLPRGTLRIDRFYKNLEWTVAMIEYTRNIRVAECTPDLFMAWVLKPENATKYPNLVNYINERFTVQVQVRVIDNDDLPQRPAPLAVSENGVRISPRTGRPVRQYTPRPGARRPGRPVGYSPVRSRREGYVFASDNQMPCCMVGADGYSCERLSGHDGEHAACNWRAVDNRVYWS